MQCFLLWSSLPLLIRVNSWSATILFLACWQLRIVKLKTLLFYKSIVAIGKHIIFTWIPSQEAKNALDDPVSNCSIPYSDFKPCIVKYILKRWQNSWDQQIHNKLHEIHSLVGKTPCSYGQNRKEQVVLTRCHMGHSRLTHSYLINNEERPECIPCNSNFSLQHTLIDCVDFADVRQTFCNVNNLYELLTNVAGDTIVKILKDINLYTKI